MNQTRNIKGIIYKMYNSGSADKVINLIDEQGHKNVLLAKGVKKPTSRKAFSIDLGNYLQCKVVDGYALPLVTEVKLLDEFAHWKKDFKKMIVLQFFCEVIDKFCFEENTDAALFKILYNTLKIETDRSVYLADIFILKVLETTGHLPKINECVMTSEEIDPTAVYYSTEYVGYLSAKGNELVHGGGEKISDRIVKTQKYIIEHSITDGMKIKLADIEEHKMLKIELSWLEQTIETKLKSKEILLNSVNNVVK